MSFLAPLFLLGALAIVGPIVFHLIRRTTREVTPFSTLMFLAPSPPRVTKRSRLENLWLLLLRCVVLALLAFAFARPFVRESARSPLTAGGAGKRVVLLVDTSASMRREKLWEQARAKAEARLAAATPADEFALMTFDRAPREVLTFDEWRKLRPEERASAIGTRLGAIAPGFGATHLDAALIRAAELLDRPESADTPAGREIVLISDLQEGATIDALQGFGWPERIAVTLAPVTATQLENAGVAWLPPSEDNGPATEENLSFRLRVNNAAESKHEQFALRWVGGSAPSAEFPAYVPAGKSRIVKAPKPPAGADRVVLTGDAVDFDNTAFLLGPQAAQVPVLFLGADTESDTHGLLYYLRRAFPQTARERVEIVAHAAPEAVPQFQLERVQLLVIGDKPADAAIESAAQFVRGGKIAVFPLGSANSASAAARLLGVSSLPITEAPVKDYAMLAQIDFQHPLFAPFADPRFSDFTKIHVWHHRRVDLSALKDARVLAKFDDGDPAVVQIPVGQGSVVLFTTTWQPADSQLALSSKFLPLMNSLLQQSSRLPVPRAQYFVGDEVPLPPGPAPLTVRRPDGRDVSAPAASNFTATDVPGVYSVSPGTMRFVVNLSPEENRTSPLGPERLTALGVPITREAGAASPATRRDVRTAAVELENRQKLWRWALLAGVALLLVETILAARLSREPSRATV